MKPTDESGLGSIAVLSETLNKKHTCRLHTSHLNFNTNSTQHMSGIALLRQYGEAVQMHKRMEEWHDAQY